MREIRDGGNSTTAYDSNYSNRDREPVNSMNKKSKTNLYAGIPAAVGCLIILILIVLAYSGCASSGTSKDSSAAIALSSGADAKASRSGDSYYGGAGAGTAAPPDAFTGSESYELPEFDQGSFNAPQHEPDKYSNPTDMHTVREGTLDWMEAIQVPEMQAMIVYTATVSEVVKDAVAAAKDVKALITKKGGYIAGMNQSGKKDDITVRITAKIPSQHLLTFIDELESVGEVVTKDVTGQDVGAEYFDLKARKEALELSYARLKDLLSKSGKLTDLLTVEKEVERTEEELNSVKGRMTQLEHWVAYSTVEIILTVEPKPDVFEKPKFSWMTKTAFSGYWTGFLTLARGLWHFVLFLAAYAPLWVAIIVVAYILRGIARARKAGAKGG